MRPSLCVGAVVVAAAPSAAAHALLAFHTPLPAHPSRGGVGSARARRGEGTCSRRSRQGYCPQQRSLLLEPRANSAAKVEPLASTAASEGVGDVSEGGRGPLSSPSLQNIPQSSLVLRDESTGCDIYLVGCLHGSHASGRDVQGVLERVRPGAVVLELCDSRHRSLRRDLEKGARGDIPLEGKARWKAVFRGWGKGVQNTTKKSGLLQGVLAGFLSAPYVVQRLGDFDPGLEFKTAMVYADASIRQQPPGTKPSPVEISGKFPEGAAPSALAAGGGEEAGTSVGVELSGVEASAVAAGVEGGAGRGGAAVGECAVVLGDRDVQETLRRLGGALTALTDRSGKGEAKGKGNKGEGAGIGGSSGGGGEGAGGQRGAAGVGVASVAGGVGVLGTGGMGELEVEAASPPEWGLVSDAKVLRMAMVGPAGRQWPDSLNVFDTVWRERQALGMLLLPLLFVLTVISEALQRSIGGAAAAAVAVTGGGGGDTALGGGGATGAFGGVGVGGSGGGGFELGLFLEAAGDVWDTIFVAWSVWYMLRFFRLVIKERDDVLAESIMKACRDHPGRPVVAVLGLLHCNGVADIIRNSAAFVPPPQEQERAGAGSTP